MSQWCKILDMAWNKKMIDKNCAAVVLKNDATLTAESLKEFIKEELIFYEVAKLPEYVRTEIHLVLYQSTQKTQLGLSKSFRTCVQSF